MLPSASFALSCTGLKMRGRAQLADTALHSRTVGAVKWLRREAWLWLEMEGEMEMLTTRPVRLKAS